MCPRFSPFDVPMTQLLQTDNEGLFSESLKYIHYLDSGYCELILPKADFSKNLYDLFVRIFQEKQIHTTLIRSGDTNRLRFKLNKRVIDLTAAPFLKGTMTLIPKDTYHLFAYQIMEHARLKFFQSTRRYELLIPPIYHYLGNDMVDILAQNNIQGHITKNKKTCLSSISFYQTPSVEKYLKTLSHAKITVEAQDYLFHSSIPKNDKTH